MSVSKYKRKELLTKIAISLLQVLLFIGFIVIWEVCARKEIINGFLFSSPSEIFALLKQYVSDGELFRHLKISLIETMLGLVIGTSL